MTSSTAEAALLDTRTSTGVPAGGVRRAFARRFAATWPSRSASPSTSTPGLHLERDRTIGLHRTRVAHRVLRDEAQVERHEIERTALVEPGEQQHVVDQAPHAQRPRAPFAAWRPPVRPRLRSPLDATALRTRGSTSAASAARATRPRQSDGDDPRTPGVRRTPPRSDPAWCSTRCRAGPPRSRPRRARPVARGRRRRSRWQSPPSCRADEPRGAATTNPHREREQHREERDHLDRHDLPVRVVGVAQ